MANRVNIPNILTIAGTDPSGGAGIQADLKAFSAAGAYGLSVITAVVAQNTCGVRAVTPMSPECVAMQLDAVFEDIRVDAVKIGMVHNSDIISVISDRLHRYKPAFVVLDPVIMAKSGDLLMAPAALEALKTELFPRATLVTPNLPEATQLTGRHIAGASWGVRDQLESLLALGPEAVLLKGGHDHASPEATDWLQQGGQTPRAFTSPRIATCNDHGTGCTLSSAIAALLPRHPMHEAVQIAKNYLFEALQTAHELTVGKGHGPLNHFHNCWPPRSPAPNPDLNRD